MSGRKKFGKKNKNWRAPFGPEEVIQRVRPEYNPDYLHNPHKGTTTFQRFEGDKLYPSLRWSDRVGPFEKTKGKKLSRAALKRLEAPLPFAKMPSIRPAKRYPPTRVSYCRWLWRTLEPEKGRFRFDIIDRALETAAKKGQTLQMRTQPYIGDLTPEWYWDFGGVPYQGKSKPLGYPVPDHNHPAYLKHWGDHIRALGERYDGHPALESFDVAYGGSCGETGGNCRRPMAEKLVDVYLKAFKKTQLVSMLGTDGCAYAGKEKRNRRLGWRADCYGDIRRDSGGILPYGLMWNHMLEAYPMEVEKNGIKESWKTAPVTLETCWTVPHWKNQAWDIDWIIDQGYKYHLSVFMPKAVFFPDEWMGKLMEFNKRIGYRFFIHNMILPLEARAGKRILIKVTIDNKGIAPIYRPYRFVLRFTQGDRRFIVPFKTDIRKWLPDFTFFEERIEFPKGLKRGEVEIDCGIVNDKNEPVVKLAIKPVKKDGWHPITNMDVL